MNIVTTIDTSEMETRIAAKVCSMLLAANSPPAEMPELLTIREAMTALRVSRGTLYGRIKEGQLQSVKIGRKRLVYSKSVKHFLQFKPERK